MRNVSELVLYIVSGPKGHSKGEWVHKFYLEEGCLESDNMQIRDFKWKALPRVLLCSSGNKSHNWSWGNSFLFMSGNSMEKGCIEARTQALFNSSAFFSCVFFQPLFYLFPQNKCFRHRQKSCGQGAESHLSFFFVLILLKGLGVFLVGVGLGFFFVNKKTGFCPMAIQKAS